MVLDASLLNTQHYKVRIKGKVEQSREGVVPSPTHCCSSYRKGSLRVTLDYGRQLYFYSFFYTKSNIKIVLVQTIQFSISTQFSSIWRIDRTLLGAITPGQSGPGSNTHEGVLRIPQSSSITGALPSDSLVSYREFSLGVSYSSAEIQSVYFASPADWSILV